MAGLAATTGTIAVWLDAPDDFDGWRAAARDLAAGDVPPESVQWQVEEGDLFARLPAPPPSSDVAPFPVPRSFVDLARVVICHRDHERFALLYRLLLRLRQDRSSMEDRADPLLHRLERMAKEVKRDAHKMHAFVRFREMKGSSGESRFVAWFEPDHHIVRREAGFFVRRFANMNWSILTPELSIHWDGQELVEGPGATRSDAPGGDPVEDMWKAYYASTFNPARVKLKAMAREMPRKYWRNMPETALIGGLVAGARARELEMIERSAGMPRSTLATRPTNVEAAWLAVKNDAADCTRCDLYKCGTQTVFGEGPVNAQILFVGEQPGDQEDIAGRPFVGPAGQLFDASLEEAGIDRARTYVTNAVKHFKFQMRGKRRLHSKPDGGEIKACSWWLEQELELIRPSLTVALGATAARSLFGKIVTISSLRGQAQQLADGSECWVTVHPSSILRARDEESRREGRWQFVADLKRIQERARALAA